LNGVNPKPEKLAENTRNGWLVVEGHEVEFDQLSNRVIGCAIEVYRTLGPGMIESAYEHCMAHELATAMIACATQVPLPIQC